MGLSTYEDDVFLKNRFHINICVILPIINNNSYYYSYLLGFTSVPEVIMRELVTLGGVANWMPSNLLEIYIYPFWFDLTDKVSYQ
jgi:hypothetical protein